MSVCKMCCTDRQELSMRCKTALSDLNCKCNMKLIDCSYKMSKKQNILLIFFFCAFWVPNSRVFWNKQTISLNWICFLSTVVKIQMVSGSSPFDIDSSGHWKTLWGLAASFLLSSTILKPLARRALRKFLFQTEGSPLARPLPLTSAQACGAKPGWKPEETPDVNRLKTNKERISGQRMR